MNAQQNKNNLPLTPCAELLLTTKFISRKVKIRKLAVNFMSQICQILGKTQQENLV